MLTSCTDAKWHYDFDMHYWHRLLLVGKFCLLLVLINMASPLAVAQQQEGTDSAPSASQLLELLNRGFTEVYEKVAPSVVVIRISKEGSLSDTRDMLRQFGFDFFMRDPDSDQQDEDSGSPRSFRMPQMPQSEGSGFIFTQEGHILTNYHVIQDASKITVSLQDGRKYEASVVGEDDKTDLAVIKIEAENLVPAQLGDSDTVKVGQLACVIGAPYNLDYSFTVGVVSAINRDNFAQAVYEQYIQTDASINPGNSGGPLVDIYGKVIGINTLINGINRGLGFAIPINMATAVADQLLANGRVIRPWLGVRIQTLAEQEGLREHLGNIEQGVIVETIEPDTPAYRSELQPADVITEVDGVAVTTARQLQQQVLAKTIGQTIDLTVWRDGELRSVKVTTEKMPDSGDVESVPQPSDSGEDQQIDSVDAYGLQIQNLSEDLVERMGLQVDKGVLVTEVEADSPADLAGILRGDVITEIDSQPVQSVSEVQELINKADSQRGILFFVDRDGEKTYAVVKAE